MANQPDFSKASARMERFAETHLLVLTVSLLSVSSLSAILLMLADIANFAMV
jgi:hypothetical protein